MEIQRYVAFSTDPAGGNPAGVVLDATGVDDATMLAAAAEIGYSETAFLTPRADGAFDVRYFSPLAEVSFCGHATIATAVAYAQRHGVGDLLLHTQAGPVPVSTRMVPSDGDSAGNHGSTDGAGSTDGVDGTVVATLTSVTPRTEPLPDAVLAEILSALRWSSEDLDPKLPPRIAYGGAFHPIIAVATRARLADLDYDMTALADLMRRHDWTTVDLVWRESETVFHARNPFPPGGVVEDPATGAAAAAFGGYLRDLALVGIPATVTVHQGDDMGRPSVITIGVPADPAAGIDVTGAGVRI